MKKFFSYKMHFILLVMVASASSSVAMLLKSNSVLEQSKQAQVRSETIQKMNPFKRLIGFKIEEIKSDLLKFALTRKSQPSNLDFGIFNSIALVQASSTDFLPKWMESNSKESPWTVEYQSAALKSIPYQKMDGSGFGWFRYQEGSGKPMYITLFEIEARRKDLNKKAYIVGLSPQNPFASVTDDYRGTTAKIFLINDKAFVAAHTNKNLDGASFSSDPIYQDIKTSKRAMSSGSFQDLKGEAIFAYYEKIEHTNLYAVVSSGRGGSAPLLNQQFKAGLPSIFGLLAFFGFAAFVFLQKILPAQTTSGTSLNILSAAVAAENKFGSESPESEFQDSETSRDDAKNLKSDLMRKGLASINPFASRTLPLSQPPLSTALSSEQSIKMTTFMKTMSKGISKIFAERISGVIAESSLILAKSKDSEIISHATTIQSEARKSRDLLRELEQFNLERSFDLKLVNLSEVCSHAIAKLARQLDDEAIEVKTEFDKDLEVKSSIEKLQTAIEKIIQNSIEALKGRDQKLIHIKILKNLDQIILTISDNGIGMAKEIEDQIFIPFYRGFANSDGNGLGLSYVKGVVDSMHGLISVQSSPGAGTQIELQFKEQKLSLISHLPAVPLYDGIKNPKLNLDFVNDISEGADIPNTYFELQESDLDQEFDQHLKRLSDKVIQKKQLPPEFNTLTDFEEDGEDADDFKVVIREPHAKTLS